MSDIELPGSLTRLAQELRACHRCHLYQHATQVVPGHGPAHARLMLVGEEPGNDEDLVGKPFVGPAGRVLDEALSEAGIERNDAFVTNAVKHFKFERRGKRRLHQRPDSKEIGACRNWLEAEQKLIKPRLILALGATAAQSLYGKTVTISHTRGRIAELEHWGHVMVTIHPSYLLRIPDEVGKSAERKKFVHDLKAARAFLES